MRVKVKTRSGSNSLIAVQYDAMLEHIIEVKDKEIEKKIAKWLPNLRITL